MPEQALRKRTDKILRLHLGNCNFKLINLFLLIGIIRIRMKFHLIQNNCRTAVNCNKTLAKQQMIIKPRTLYHNIFLCNLRMVYRKVRNRRKSVNMQIPPMHLDTRNIQPDRIKARLHIIPLVKIRNLDLPRINIKNPHICAIIPRVHKPLDPPALVKRIRPHPNRSLKLLVRQFKYIQAQCRLLPRIIHPQRQVLQTHLRRNQIKRLGQRPISQISIIYLLGNSSTILFLRNKSIKIPPVFVFYQLYKPILRLQPAKLNISQKQMPKIDPHLHTFNPKKRIRPMRNKRYIIHINLRKPIKPCLLNSKLAIIIPVHFHRHLYQCFLQELIPEYIKTNKQQHKKSTHYNNNESRLMPFILYRFIYHLLNLEFLFKKKLQLIRCSKYIFSSAYLKTNNHL